MVATIADVLEAARTHIASLSGLVTGLGTPIDSQSGLFILPYNFMEDQHVHNNPRLPDTLVRQNLIVQCLLMPSPSDHYAAIDEGLRSLTEKSMIISGESKIQVIVSQLPVDELTQVLISAGISYRMAISFELRWA